VRRMLCFVTCAFYLLIHAAPVIRYYVPAPCMWEMNAGTWHAALVRPINDPHACVSTPPPCFFILFF
jgi:hypothetical protein